MGGTSRASKAADIVACALSRPPLPHKALYFSIKLSYIVYMNYLGGLSNTLQRGDPPPKSVNVFAKSIFLVHSYPNLAHFEPCQALFALLV